MNIHFKQHHESGSEDVMNESVDRINQLSAKLGNITNLFTKFTSDDDSDLSEDEMNSSFEKMMKEMQDMSSQMQNDMKKQFSQIVQNDNIPKKDKDLLNSLQNDIKNTMGLLSEDSDEIDVNKLKKSSEHMMSNLQNLMKDFPKIAQAQPQLSHEGGTSNIDKRLSMIEEEIKKINQQLSAHEKIIRHLAGKK